ncbi:energy-coupling factor transporter transmembrane component T [Desulfitobacterium chlororespirans]|uniref:Energy-coupling factor transport system permease protein n=1 Tax=Desulfitobacterium chlororespirans DSM 11544 TaxID=1121395 RepID=A0A1M7TIK2_9FIRM|nr:energy-coupling factor transporter transmembrane component T [Desulfitobacterium chlororespirans]SHN70511.1 energy-coupling factor transport system permease protein [Desulfitobacterium chlororespirans DSM 11544]
MNLRSKYRIDNSPVRFSGTVATESVYMAASSNPAAQASSGLSLDPRAKLLILVLINITVFFHTGLYTEMFCIALICTALLYHKRYTGCAKAIAAYGALLLLVTVSTNFHNTLVAMLAVVFILARKMLPIALVASLLVSSTRVGEMIAALQKARVPRNIIVPMAVTLRFFPTIREEFAGVLDAMKVRGIRFSLLNILRHPLLFLEYILVPMMLRLSVVADELSAAAVTRGIDSDLPRTSYHQVRWSTADTIFSVLFLVLAAIALSGGLEVLL